MVCSAPFFKHEMRAFFPCGQCISCRVNRRRVWLTRLVLESTGHKDISYITLTYADEFLPDKGYLSKSDLQSFFKRLRYYVPDVRLRYFACGEYGEQTHRPHYHGILFGLDPFLGSDKCVDSWTKGFVKCVPATIETMRYVAGYVTKKLVHQSADYKDYPPEFILSSRRPGLGAYAVAKLALSGLQNGDVPKQVLVGGKPYPLGRYMTEKLRQAMMNPDYIEKLKLAVMWNKYNDLQMLIEKHFGKFAYSHDIYWRAYKKEFQSKWASAEAKSKIFGSRGGI